MKPRTRAILYVVIVAAFSVAVLTMPKTPPPLLANGGFEGSQSNNTTPVVWWDSDGTRNETYFGNFFTPTGWQGWFAKHPCQGNGDMCTQPEAGLISRYVDPYRVHSGNAAFRMFATWKPHDGGLWQVVSVESGTEYRARLYAHAWHSQCTSEPHYPVCPLDYSCFTGDEHDPDPDCFDSSQWLSIGLDPTGGLDPRASTIEWSTYEAYGQYAGALYSPVVAAQGVTMTLYLRSETEYPLRYNDAHFDDVEMWAVRGRVWLPRALR